MRRCAAMVLVCGFLTVHAADSLQFRGPHRNGKFLEQGLLTKWPAEGPREVWHFEQAGIGYASVSVEGDKLYTTGAFDGVGYLMCIDGTGQQVWRAKMGPSHEGGYPGTRTTPTIDGDGIYVFTSLGKLIRFGKDGKSVWELDTLASFQGNKPDRKIKPRWGMSESVLIDGDIVVCTPGGENASIVGVDKNSGQVRWQTKGLSDISGYCSPIIFDNGQSRHGITLTGHTMVGFNTQSGDLLWQHPYPAKYKIHAVSPVFEDNYLFVADGYKQGGKMFEISDNGKHISQRWEERKIDVHHGGCVVVDGYIYGAGTHGQWLCVEMKSGQIKKTIVAVGKGAVVYADGKLYCYGERGTMGLLGVGPGRFAMISSFRVKKGTGEHWAHPVIANGNLYIRHGQSIMAYSVKK